MSPTARSLAHLRSLGYTARVVERWNPFAKIRQDLLGAAEIRLWLSTKASKRHSMCSMLERAFQLAILDVGTDGFFDLFGNISKCVC